MIPIDIQVSGSKVKPFLICWVHKFFTNMSCSINLTNQENACRLFYPCIFGSSGGAVVKLLACRAKGPGFDSRSRHYNFRDWLSLAPSRDMAERSLKRY